MYLEGTFLGEAEVFLLTSRLRDAGFSAEAASLEDGRRRGEATLLTLDSTERAAIVQALKHSTGSLAQLRDSMIRELEWRHKHGLGNEPTPA